MHFGQNVPFWRTTYQMQPKPDTHRQSHALTWLPGAMGHKYALGCVPTYLRVTVGLHLVEWHVFHQHSPKLAKIGQK